MRATSRTPRRLHSSTSYTAMAATAVEEEEVERLREREEEEEKEINWYPIPIASNSSPLITSRARSAR